VRGPLQTRILESCIGDLGSQLGTWLGDLPIAGLLSLAFDVDRAGAVKNLKVLSDTTRVPLALERDRTRLVRQLKQSVSTWRLGKQRGPSRVTLPLVFERG
jgi:hypothetical protein